MRRVQVHVNRDALADKMATMRSWLDRHGDPVVRFETALDERSILISVEFPSPELAVVFQGEFGGELSSAA
jgi:hypothetical protein